MPTHFKSRLLITLFSLSLLGVTAWAQINVKSDLSNAIQNIQEVYFSPEGLKHPDPDKNILLESRQGILHIHGKVLNEKEGAYNTLHPNATGAILIQGQGNSLQGERAVMIGGTDNIIKVGSENSAIMAG